MNCVSFFMCSARRRSRSRSDCFCCRIARKCAASRPGPVMVERKRSTTGPGNKKVPGLRGSFLLFFPTPHRSMTTPTAATLYVVVLCVTFLALAYFWDYVRLFYACCKLWRCAIRGRFEVFYFLWDYYTALRRLEGPFDLAGSWSDVRRIWGYIGKELC
jgi:hypothetical protein